MRIIFLLGFIVFLPFLTFSQDLCSGILGDNIFSDGDFGRGRENIPNDNPEIAPGYTYTRSVPPPDGSYTITNDMRRWSSNYGTWISIPDNSSDADGYMMVVNASYQPGVFYEKTINGLCQNTLYEFSADVINVVKRNTFGHILPEVDFLIDGEVKYSTGEVPQDEQWKKHGFTFTLPPDKTSVKLTLINRAPGGTGNDLALDNITFRPCGPDGTIEVEDERSLALCEGEGEPFPLTAVVDTTQNKVQWQKLANETNVWEDVGMQNTLRYLHDEFSPGVYRYRFIAAGTGSNLLNEKCRTVSEEIELEVTAIDYEKADTFCRGTEYDFNGRDIGLPGTYTDTLISRQGCDSIVHLNLVEAVDIPIEAVWKTMAPSCFNFEDGTINLLSIEGGYPPYMYTLNGGNKNFAGTFGNLPSGEYSVYYEDRLGCHNTDQLSLINPEEFIVEVPGDTVLDLGDEIEVSVRGNQSIESVEWEPPGQVVCSDCENTVILAIHTSEFKVKVENNAGCSIEERFTVTVDKENLPVAFPNAFSPDGDGNNDSFAPVARQNLVQSVEELKIFDKWGNVLFDAGSTSFDLTKIGWNGISDGVPVPNGVYFYQCRLKLLDGQVYRYAGDVLLIR